MNIDHDKINILYKTQNIKKIDKYYIMLKNIKNKKIKFKALKIILGLEIGPINKYQKRNL